MNRFIVIVCVVFLGGTLIGQEVQNIKGNVLDRDSEIPLIGATVQIRIVDDLIGTISDVDGRFILSDIPVGRHNITVSYVGYDDVTIPNILLTSGKEVELDIEMQESLVGLDEVVVTAAVDKDKTINEMAAVSARTFSLEEVTRYSGGRNDASRLVANFAGVSTSNDSRNDIVVRGNSPAGILWRMEGVPIPNPNHFSTLGTTGGPVSALNTNLLKNSDFLTSAFPSEYGNAIGGVFDVGLRSGNKDKFEFTGQLAAFSGLEAMAEGPIGSTGDKSFLVSYRYSFTQLASVFGLDFGTNATPNYQDLSFNLDLGNTRLGKLSVFGIGAMSDITFLAQDVDEGDLFAASDADAIVNSKFGVFGIKHSYLLDDKSYIKTTLSISGSNNTYDEFRYADSTLTNSYSYTKVDDGINRLSLHSFYNRKFSARLTTKVGITADQQMVNSSVEDRGTNPDLDNDGLPDFRTIRDIDDGILQMEPYANVKYRPSDKWTLILGLHGQIQTFKTKYNIEPRLGVNYSVTDNARLNFGYGLHSQSQPIPVFFNLGFDTEGNYRATNEDLDLTKSHHFVLGWDQKFGKSWRSKVEAYYQSLYDAPVESFSSSFSMLNAGADFVFPTNGSLINEGTGRNYGIELTIEKFFSQGYYGLFTTSVFESKYKGSDGIERNTAFNNQYVINLLGGKEWQVSKKTAITTDFKITAAGGRYITPIDLEGSQAKGEQVELEEFAYSEKLNPYFRLDFKIGYRINSKNFSQQFFIDFQNVTNHDNIFTKRYNRETNELNTVYQIGFFPDILWRIQF